MGHAGYLTIYRVPSNLPTPTYFRRVLLKKESAEMVEAVFSHVKSTLENGKKLKIGSFGSFEVKQKADRRGRNPQTGESFTIPVVSDSQKAPIIGLVQKIITNPDSSNFSQLEAEIERLVYELYGVVPKEEITLVEGKKWLCPLDMVFQV